MNWNAAIHGKITKYHMSANPTTGSKLAWEEECAACALLNIEARNYHEALGKAVSAIPNVRKNFEDKFGGRDVILFATVSLTTKGRADPESMTFSTTPLGKITTRDNNQET